MTALKGKTMFITGATRGIGEAIAMKCARDGANIVVTGKTVEPNPKLPGTIYSVAEAIEAAGGQALPIQLDVRNDEQIQQAVAETVKRFGGIDILINNASAISLSATLDTPMKRFDLMFDVNVRATYACAQACIPHLMKANNPHILTLSPPISLDPKWFKDHLAYTMSKYGMSMCTLGLSAELAHMGIAVNSLWPRTTIATAAIAVHFPEAVLNASRKPEIMADAAYAILKRNSRENTGHFYIDENVLKEAGINDFSHYALKPGTELFPDLFLE